MNPLMRELMVMTEFKDGVRAGYAISRGGTRRTVSARRVLTGLGGRLPLVRRWRGDDAIVAVIGKPVATGGAPAHAVSASVVASEPTP